MFIFVNLEQLLKEYSPIIVTDEGITISCKFENLFNDILLIVVTFDVITNLTIYDFMLSSIELDESWFGSHSNSLILHPLNILLPNDLTDEGIETFLNDRQLEKEEDPIEVTDSGINNSFKFEHPEKEFCPILVIEEENSTEDE